jgi:predicted phosphoribosyltransferase
MMKSNQLKRFGDRMEAGRELAQKLTKYRNEPGVVVLAIPKGGVPVGVGIAEELEHPFDVLLIGKITAPGCGGTSLGALTSGGVRMLNCAMIDRLHLSEEEIRNAVFKECQHIAHRERLYRGDHPSVDVADRTVILVDDGSTPCVMLRNAIRLLRRQHADRVVVALPALCRNSACDLRFETEEVVTLAEPASPAPAGRWFRHFPPTSDHEVRCLLERQFAHA